MDSSFRSKVIRGSQNFEIGSCDQATPTEVEWWDLRGQLLLAGLRNYVRLVWWLLDMFCLRNCVNSDYLLLVTRNNDRLCTYCD